MNGVDSLTELVAHDNIVDAEYSFYHHIPAKVGNATTTEYMHVYLRLKEAGFTSEDLKIALNMKLNVEKYVPNLSSSDADDFYGFAHYTGSTFVKMANDVTDFYFAMRGNGDENMTITHVVIPYGVTELRGDEEYACAFESTPVVAVSIPNSVTTINEYCFDGCDSLASIVIPESVTTIKNNSFENCRGLASIVIPSQILVIESWLLSGCTGLINIGIPQNAKAIDSYAFSGCTRLEYINIPSTLLSIGDSAFYNCNSLNYNEYGNAKYLGNSSNPYFALFGVKNTSITTCTINPNTKIMVGGLFADCSNLTYNTYSNAKYLGAPGNDYFALITATSNEITSCEINSNTVFIYASAFVNCGGLTSSFTLPTSVISIGDNAFGNCSYLGNVTMQSGVLSIGANAFNGCDSLPSVYISDTVKFIGECVFDNTFGGFSTVFIPASVEVICGPFSGGQGGTSVTSIKCEAASKPTGWASNWNYNKSSEANITTTWGQTR